jgi:Tfp pilus assembly protein PilF
MCYWIPPIAVFLLLLVPSGDQPAKRPRTSPSFEALSRQAVTARDAGHLDEAVALFRKALKEKPDWDEGWWNIGSIAYDRDQYTECAQSFEQLTALKPDSASGWTMSGLCEYRLRHFDSALRSLKQAERLRFQEPLELAKSARLHFALVLIRTGTFEKAINVLSDLTKFDRKTSQIVVAAGIAGLRQPWLPSEVPESERAKVILLGGAMATGMELDFKDAIPQFEALVQQFPNDPNVHFRFGAFLMQQAPERGLAELQKTLELDPEYIQALVGFAMIYLNRGEPQTAREYAERAVKARPVDFGPHVALGRSLLALNDDAGAAKELEIAVNIEPDNPDAHFSLASAYSHLGRKEDAQREHEEFKRLKKLIDSSQP